MVDKLLDLLAPAACHWCGTPGKPGLSCEPCRDRLPWLLSACPRCALPLPGPPEVRLCIACQVRPPPQDLTWAGFRYAPPVAGKIIGLKFRGQLGAARLLAELVSGRLAARPAPLPELLVPVPLHPGRLQQRGYNQAGEIARYLSRNLAVPVRHGAARRVVATAEQSRLEAPARRRNVRGAFVVGTSLRGRSVALLDDVMTTGATLAELARAVRQAGARHVEAWAVARADLSA